MHPGRRLRTQHLLELGGQGEWEDLYRQTMLWEFAHEARMGWQLAFLRPFCTPGMAKTLVDAGHLVHSPLKRAYDTGLIIYEIVYHGLEHPRARQMVSIMNQAHHGRNLKPQDMTYVLSAFIVAPYRYIEWAGWRPLLDVEKQAAVHFYDRLGALMNIENRPSSYEEAETLLDAYEAENVIPSPDAAILGSKLMDVFRGRLPKPLRPRAVQLFGVLLNDRRIDMALGYEPPARPLQLAANVSAKLYGLVHSWMRPMTKPIFTPGNKAGHAYPSGYKPEDLGPHATTPKGGTTHEA